MTQPPDSSDGQPRPESPGEGSPTPADGSRTHRPRKRLGVNAAIAAAVIGALATITAAIINLAKPESHGSPSGEPSPNSSVSANPADAACGPNPYERTYSFDESSLSKEPENWIQTGDSRAIYEDDGRLHLDSYLAEPGAPKLIQGQVQRQPSDVPICEADFTFTVDKAADTHDGGQFIIYDHEGRTQRVSFGPYNGGGGFEYWICAQARCDDSKFSSFDHPGETHMALGEPVFIRVIADGQRIWFFTGEKLVTSVSSNGWFSGIKFYVSAAGKQSWRTSVDNVHLKSPRL